ncbi:hypothetical protein FCH28_23770 [Streptomyces piniterrae]|uniref:Uncharacterized protein n=1 Tax=Streptomyces piniterrae TaxID=2571125 RepID=A0A4U0N9D9_9ACTN|nr:hypothetical protein [Streptomyces piniterrae]TJZ50306.1 hypothetical protein FCH28_23770 [Streptomyces piniterrae]
MGKPDTRRLDKAIQQTTRKLEAVRNRELWPLEGRERRAVLGALTSGSYSTHRGNGTGRAERQLETAWTSAETRLITELTVLNTERQRVANEAAADRAAKKSSGWW